MSVIMIDNIVIIVVCIYIYIYVERERERERDREREREIWTREFGQPAQTVRRSCTHRYTRQCTAACLRANYYTPDLTNMNIHWKMLLKIHCTIPVTIHWTSDNPLEHTAEM